MPEQVLPQPEPATPANTLHRLIFPELPAEDLPIVLEFCEKRGLDPWANQVCAVYRWDALARKQRLMVLVKIDGLRARAAATQQYCGNDAATFVDDDDGRPLLAKCAVYRLISGERHSYSAEARWRDYYPADGDSAAWDRMPHVMLGKVAEALALRKGFPELGGLYTLDEMAQAPASAPDTTFRRPWEPDHTPEPARERSSPRPAPADGGPAPETRRQLELRMLDIGFRDQAKRTAVVRKFIAFWPGMFADNEPEFCRRVWNVLVQNPAHHGAEVAEMAT